MESDWMIDTILDVWLEEQADERAEFEASLDDEDDALDLFRDYWAGN